MVVSHRRQIICFQRDNMTYNIGISLYFKGLCSVRSVTTGRWAIAVEICASRNKWILKIHGICQGTVHNSDLP